MSLDITDKNLTCLISERILSSHTSSTPSKFHFDNLDDFPKNCGVEEVCFDGFVRFSSKFQLSSKNAMTTHREPKFTTKLYTVKNF